MALNDVPGRTVRASFNHSEGVGKVRINYDDRRRSNLSNTLEALNNSLADFAQNSAAGTVFLSTRVWGAPRETVWEYAITTEPIKGKP